LRNPKDIERIVPRVLEEAEGIDVLVNGAGIYPNKPVVEMEEEEWDRVMNTNLKAPFLLCRAVARAMIKRGRGGKIVNIGSGAAFSGRVGASHYCTSKAGLLMFTKVLALELARHKINVNVVSPGLTEVNSALNPLSEEYLAALTKNIPLGRMAEPEDIAPTVVFLSSGAADYITGAELSVNGGSTAGRAFLPLSG
jgi:NAD(P)-dependent dehydrogenase (short-subunit alcohol dehydrogenase family)